MIFYNCLQPQRQLRAESHQERSRLRVLALGSGLVLAQELGVASVLAKAFLCTRRSYILCHLSMST